MKRIVLVLTLALLPACAHLGLTGSGDRGWRELWTEAHTALAAQEFARAESVFERLAEQYPATDPGRESLFYLGTIRLDPRNPEWDPAPAESALRRYLAADTADERAPHRAPEARTLLELAAQLNMPAERRVPGLQPETRVVTERVVVPARESRALAAEVQRLKQELRAREAEVARQREELERIRKTLTGKKQ